MASIESRIDAFITEHELETSIKDELCVLVTGCMGDLFKHVFTEPVPEATKTKKVLKSEKIEDPTTCETLEELRNCTTGVLNEFCKSHGLKIGGNKKEIMERVWRHIQGESSDDDKSSRSKPKAAKKTVEKHVCGGTNLAGVPCGSAATEEFEGCHFCWHHIKDAQKFVNAQNTTKPKKPEPKKTEPEIVPAESSTKHAKPTKQRAKYVPTKKPEPVVSDIDDELVEEDM
jgi:hypothetical protein